MSRYGLTCREGVEFESFVRTQLFLQRVYDLSDSLRLRRFFKTGTALTADVGFANDTFWKLTDAEVRQIFKELKTPRVLVTEVIHGRGLIDYTEIAASAHYQLVRCRFIRSALTEDDIAAMEFLKEADDDQISEDRAARQR